MRAFRLLTIIATLLALSGQGFAAAAHVRSCQVQLSAPYSRLSAQGPSGQQVAQPTLDTGDCCGDASNKAPCERSGKHDPCNPCKAGYNCKVSPAYELTQGTLMSVIPARQSAVERLPTLVLSPSPFGLWRPPRSI